MYAQCWQNTMNLEFEKFDWGFRGGAVPPVPPIPSPLLSTFSFLKLSSSPVGGGENGCETSKAVFFKKKLSATVSPMYKRIGALKHWWMSPSGLRVVWQGCVSCSPWDPHLNPGTPVFHYLGLHSQGPQDRNGAIHQKTSQEQFRPTVVYLCHPGMGPGPSTAPVVEVQWRPLLATTRSFPPKATQSLLPAIFSMTHAQGSKVMATYKSANLEMPKTDPRPQRSICTGPTTPQSGSKVLYPVESKIIRPVDLLSYRIIPLNVSGVSKKWISPCVLLIHVLTGVREVLPPFPYHEWAIWSPYTDFWKVNYP